MFNNTQDDENFDRLITQIKQRLSHGQNKQDIVKDFVDIHGRDNVFFAYHSAVILVKYEILESLTCDQ